MEGSGAPTAAPRLGEEKRAREEEGTEGKEEEEEETQPKEEKRHKEEPGPADGSEPEGDADGWDAEAIKTIAGGLFGAFASLGSGPAPSPSTTAVQSRFGAFGAPAPVFQQSQQQQPQGAEAGTPQQAAASSSPAFGPGGAVPSGLTFGAAAGPTFGAAAAPAFGAAAAPAFGAAAAPAFGAAVGSPQAFGFGGIGFRTGGAQDVKNFRENVTAGYLPLPSDVSFEGICKDYYFSMEPTGREGEGREEGKSGGNDGEGEQQAQDSSCELFYPTYSLALAPDPILAATMAAPAAAGPAAPAAPPTAEAAPPAANPAMETGAALADVATGAVAGTATAMAPPPPDLFLSVGLGSGLAEFKRPRLNLVVLLDISRSMSAPFDTYYYDSATGKRQELSPVEKWQRKMDVAKECLLGVLDLLREDDSVSVVLFNDRVCVPKRMGPLRTSRLDEIRAGVKALSATGGTNLQLGIETAAAQLRQYSQFQKADPVTTESRVLLLTDAQPNVGLCGGEDLGRNLKACALDGIHATCVGVGLDFNTDLVAEIFKIKGANYFSVHSPGEFKQRLCDDFDMAVSPLVFDLSLRVEAASLQAGWKVLDVNGSPNSEDTVLGDDGVALMKVHTLFPSPKTEAGVKGGVVLIKVAPPEPITATDAGATASIAQPESSEGAAGAAQPAAGEGGNATVERGPAEGSACTAQPAPLGLKVQYGDRAGRIFTSAAEVALPADWLAAEAGRTGGSGGSSSATTEEGEGAGGRVTAEVDGSGGGQAGAGATEAGEGQDEGDTAAVQQEQQQEEQEQQKEERQKEQGEGARQPSGFTPRFQSTGVRKAVALVRYVGALQTWLKEEWDAQSQPGLSQNHTQWAAFGPPQPSQGLFGQPPPLSWAAFGGGSTLFGAGDGRGSSQERQSRELSVGPAARARFAALLPFMRREAEEVDPELQQEVEVLERLIQVADESPARKDDSTTVAPAPGAQMSNGAAGRPFRPTTFRNDRNQEERMHHISAMPENDSLSPEELRLEAYQEAARGLWPAGSTPVFPPPATDNPPAHQTIPPWPPSAAAVRPQSPPDMFAPRLQPPRFSFGPSSSTSINLSGDMEEVVIVVEADGSVDVKVKDRANTHPFAEDQHHVIPPGTHVRICLRPNPGGSGGASQPLFGRAGGPFQAPQFGAAGTGAGSGAQHASTPAFFGLGATGAGCSAGFGSSSAGQGIPAFWGASTPSFGSGSGGSPSAASPEFQLHANAAAAGCDAPSGGSGFGQPSTFAALGMVGATTVAPVFGGTGGGGSGSFDRPVTSCRPAPRQPSDPTAAFGAGSVASGAVGSSPPQGLFGSGPASAAAPGFGSTSSTAPGFGSTSSAAGQLFGSPPPASSAGFEFGVPSTMPPIFGSQVAGAAAGSGFGSPMKPSAPPPASSAAQGPFGSGSSTAPAFGFGGFAAAAATGSNSQG